MFQKTVTILEHVQLAERTYRVRVQCPEIAQTIHAGQFVMVRLPGRSDPLLGRPFALYDVSADGQAFDFVYLVVGKMTAQLAELRAGESLDIWGPLGKPFLDLGDVDQVTFVAGGIGQTPFLAYAKELKGKKIELIYGVRSRKFAAGVDDFERAGVKVHLCSDDGSLGFHGNTIQLLESLGKRGSLVGCGPEPMLHALTNLAKKWDVTCHVSLETPMACGAGICFSCVTKVKTSDGWDYKRVCMDGPVFDACQLVWE